MVFELRFEGEHSFAHGDSFSAARSGDEGVFLDGHDFGFLGTLSGVDSF